MPINLIQDSTLGVVVTDKEFNIINEDLLSELVAKVILGYYSQIKKIINSTGAGINKPNCSNEQIAFAKEKLKYNNDVERYKRDGWIFQIISWIVLVHANKNNNKLFFCQQPHDAPAQHGIDGIALLLDNNSNIKSIIITEDKCTENQRNTIKDEVLNEFKLYEEGKYDNKIVSRISAMIENINDGELLHKIITSGDLYKIDKRTYRIGININDSYKLSKNRTKLFKGYDNVVSGDVERRTSSTYYNSDIRVWMDDFCKKIVDYLTKCESNQNV